MWLLRRITHHGLIGSVKLVPVNLRHLCRYLAPSAIAARRRDRHFDRRYGTKTSGVIRHDALGVAGDSAAAATRYEPTPVASFDAITQFLPREIAKFRFIDYGSGRGRVLLLASRYPFKEIIGIEFSERLHRNAEMNLRKFFPPERVCRNAKSLLMDAALYVPPPGPTVFFLYNPFGRELMAKVLKHIEDVHLKSDAELYLLYYHPVHQDLILESSLWTRIATQYQWAVFARRDDAMANQGSKA